MPDPLIDLSTVVPEHETVRIDGVTFELLTRDDFGLVELSDINRAWRRVTELEQKPSGEMSKTDDTEYRDLVKKIVRMVLKDIPNDVVEKMHHSQRMAVGMGFFGNPNDPTTRMVAARINQQVRLTGDGSSPNSNGSTEEILPVGSTSPSAFLPDMSKS